jgi:enediyne biosynthesis protein E4
VPAPLIGCTQQNWTHAQDREAFRLGGNSGSTSCADLNNDGYMDLVTGEIRHWWAGEGSDGSQVLLNDGKGDVTFTRQDDKTIGLFITPANAGWNEGHMTQVVFDFDNDGLLDIYQGDSDYDDTRGRLYHQVKGSTLKFEEVDFKTDGIDHNRSHGVVAADFDRDGDLDLIVGHSRMRCGTSGQCYATNTPRFFENVIGNKNAWVQLKLVGEGISPISRVMSTLPSIISPPAPCRASIWLHSTTQG